jgi:hypothetical protein
MKATEIIALYTSGEKTLEETNAALYEIRAGFHLNPEKNVIKPDEVGRYGLLDTGTATLDKVEIKDGELVNADMGGMYALCLFNGKTYRVVGKKLMEEV